LALGLRVKGSVVTAVFAHEGQACRLEYAIACDEQWRTLSAVVSGWVGERDVEVLMHPADLEGLSVTLRDAVANRNRGQLIAYFTRHPGEATPITDGQLLPILGGLRVVHTPGHTPGSVCLYAERHKLLFVGDMLQVIRRRVTYASSVFSEDLPLARASVARIAELDVETIVFSHYPPWRDGANDVLRALTLATAPARS